MSNLNAVRSARRFGMGVEMSGLRRLGPIAVVGVVGLAMVCGLAEIHFLPTFSADDFSTILFGAG